jgi:Ala-tRNA(Pro) deacylase
MTMSAPMSNFLTHHHIDYSILKHKPTPGSLEVAQAAAIPLQQLVYSIVLQQQQRPEKQLLALIPASHHLDMDKVTQALGQPYQIIDRQDLRTTFQDCQPGIIPGLGQPFNLNTVTDIRLFQMPQLYLEDGDNTELIKLKQQQFVTLMSSCPRYDLCKSTTQRSLN